MQVSPQQVYQEVLNQGGSTTQAQVAAALVDGVESDGDPTELAGGTGPAQGLFQFEPGTWTGSAGGGKNGLPSAVGAASWQQQITGFLNATGGKGGSNFGAWGPDLVANSGDPNNASNSAYGYSGAPQPGSRVANTIAKLNLGPGATSIGSMSAADWTSLYAASQVPGGTAYLQAANAANQAASVTGTGGSGGSSTSSSGPSVTETIPGYGTLSVTGQQADALDTIRGTLSAYGFTSDQTNQLTQWAWGEILAGTDATQVAIDLQTPGTEGYNVFEQQFPGFVAANAQLNAQGLSALSVKDYAAYQTNATQLAQAAGLPSGFINKDNVGVLVGNNVSTSELTSRINNAMVLAYQSTPEQRAQFNTYFGTNYANDPFWGQSASSGPVDWTALQAAAATPGGAAYLSAANAAAHPTAPTPGGGLTPGQIAAIALDPQIAEPLIAQQIQAAQIGGASVTAGVGSLDVATATKLAQAGITTDKATSTFQNIAPLSALETARPGMGGEAAQGTITPDQLAAGNLLGDPAAQRQEQTAIEVAKAPFVGGGGPVTTSKGAVGAGSANPNGSA